MYMRSPLSYMHVTMESAFVGTYVTSHKLWLRQLQLLMLALCCIKFTLSELYRTGLIKTSEISV